MILAIPRPPFVWVLGLALATIVTPRVAAEPVTLIADRVLRPDGTLAAGLAVVIAENGTIERIVPADTAGLPAPRRFPPGSVLTPGLHDLFGRLGAPDETADATRVLDPNARASRAIDPLRADLDRARRGGVLYATVAPAPVNPVAGRAVTFRTGCRPRLDVMNESLCVLAIGTTALDPLREPTSRAGLRNWLARWLANPRPGGNEIVFCDEPVDVRMALDLFADRPRPVVVLSENPGDTAPWLEPGDTRVVLGPFDETTPLPELAGAATVARAGVDVAFRGAMPADDERSLRLSAFLAVQAGMDPATARRAMTSVPARIAGLADRTGSIEPGLAADLVVFSGDPIDLRSDVLAIYVRGIRQLGPSASVPTLEESP